MRFEIKRNDLLPAISGICMAGNSVVPLVGDVSVRFKMSYRDSGIVKVDQPASIFGDGLAGKVFYEWSGLDTNIAGFFNAEFEVTFATKKQTFPSDHSLEVVVFPDVS